jgi:Tfp pilus assembly protein PilX
MNPHPPTNPPVAAPSAVAAVYDRRPAVADRRDRRGVALILTLAILALVTLLLIAFVTSMRVENAASKNFNELVKARELARAGVDEVVGTLRKFAPLVTQNGPGYTGTNYVTAPGAIYAYSQNIPTPTHWTNVALYTVDPGNPNGVIPTSANLLMTNEVDLNANLVITGSGAVYNATSTVYTQLWVGWSSVTATVNGVSQMVGRYAYWVDDESAKINVNVAGSRGNDSEGYTPAGLDLRSLGFLQQEVASLTNYIQTTRPLDTIESMMMLTPPLTVNPPNVTGITFSNTQFYVTAHATSPDVTPWGDWRMSTLYLSNLVANAANPQAAVSAVLTFLNNEDSAFAAWTGLGNKFGTKYGNANLQQIAANIVDYIGYPGSADIPTVGPGTPPTYLGLKETPYLNELVISNTFQAIANPSTGIATLQINSYPLVELWYMYTNSAGWTSAGNPQVPLQYALGMTIGGGFSPSAPTISGSSTITGPTSMGPNAFWYPTGAIAPIWTTTCTYNFGQGNPPTSVTVSLNPSTATATFSQNGTLTDYAVIGLTNSTVYTVPVGNNVLGQTVSAVWASQCDDPRVKPVSTDWQLDPSPSLGSINSGSYNRGTVTTATSLPADGDTSCHIVSVNLPNTTGSGRLRGAMTPGELAFIHTGVPWRTLHLQPLASGETAPPDWVMLDWFSGANTLSTDVVGRVNINQDIHAVTPITRFNPTYPSYPGSLYALLTNLQGWAYSQQSAAFNMTNYPSGAVYYVQNPTTLAVNNNFCPSAYTMVGEIANTQSLSNFGTSPSTPKSVLETPVRDIINLITTRSDTFTIWCVGQSVKKVDKTNPTSFVYGTDVVTGEAKVRAVVERYEDATTTPPTIKFRTLYYRYYYQ